MTTKYKIIAGFSLMVFLLGAITFLGYNDIQKVSDGFDTYRRMARLNVASSDLEASMNSAAYAIFYFLDTQNPKQMDTAREAVTNAAAQLKRSKELARRPETLAMIEELEGSIQPFLGFIGAIQSGTLTAQEHYEKRLQPDAVQMTASLNQMATQAKAVGNLDALFVITDIWEEFAAARSALGQFAESRMEDDAKQAHAHLEKVSTHLQTLGTVLHTPEGKKLHEDLAQSLTTLNKAFNAMEAQYATLGTALKGINDTLKAMLSTSHKFSAAVNDQMNDAGTAMLESNKAAQEHMLMVGAAGLLLGAAFAIFIIYGIIRVLNAVSAFATAVSKGDFAYPIKVREKGEIGTMIAAMQAIPAVLDKLTQQVGELTNGVLAGRFRDRLDSSHFDGSFAGLTKALNAVSDAYTATLDALPVPIACANPNRSMQFLNAAAQKVLGGNWVNESCIDHLKAEIPSPEASFGSIAMAKNAPHTGELFINPQGRRMAVSITALPLHDLQQKVIGYMQIITDLTEIKSKQTTMLQVAQDASEISSRVAAASEELAAQVEQISRGSEIQRTRVESTASAMTQMNSTVLEVARNAGQASEQSEDTRKKAEEGATLVNQMVDSITTINTVAQTLQANMQELGKQAESIGGVMNVISDIADQTNLLALNAAIEAARAGEAGRGFAVVADEVRKLAEKTMTATQEVGTSINAIQHSARANIGEVSSAVSSINDATGLARSSGQALREIVNLATANSSVVTSIATAAEEQSATSEEINRAIDEINHVIGETTEGLVQSSAAVMDLARTAQELRSVMEGLK